MSSMTLHLQIKGQGPALVFFHGWGFDHSVWNHLAGLLEQRYTLYLVDMPGFGASDIMSWECFKEHLLQKLPARFAVTGWSMGGLYAMRLAAEEPVRVTRLLITASTPCFIRTPQWPGIEKKIFDGFLANLMRDPQQTIRDFVRLQTGNNSLLLPSGHKASPNGLKLGLQIIAQWDLRATLDEIKQPVVFVFGRLDSIVPRTTITAMRQRYPDFNLVMFPKAAHMPFLSHQQDFTHLLEQFLL
ncbi:biotin operon repressor and biotin [Legionella spiritensis]|nr:biotin operon repressor and biotin [Legionella spiritensis]